MHVTGEPEICDTSLVVLWIPQVAVVDQFLPGTLRYWCVAHRYTHTQT